MLNLSTNKISIKNKTPLPKQWSSLLVLSRNAVKLASLLGYDNSAGSQSSYASNYCDTLNTGVRRTLGVGSGSSVSGSLSVNSCSSVSSISSRPPPPVSISFKFIMSPQKRREFSLSLDYFFLISCASFLMKFSPAIPVCL